MKLYFKIASSGDLKLLLKEGSADTEECADKWEELIKINSEINGSSDYSNYFNSFKRYELLINERTLVLAMLTKLKFLSQVFKVGVVADDETLKYLNTKGYRIIVSDREKFITSIDLAFRKASNLVTKIKMKQNELLKQFEENKNAKGSGFEETLANLNAGLGFSVPPDITLAMFNEYKKIIKKRQPKKQLTDVRA